MEHFMRHDLSHIQEVTLRCMDITPGEWKSKIKTREARIVRAKQIIAYIANMEGYTSVEISKHLGLHRTTIIHHTGVMQSEYVTYPRLRELVDNVIEHLSLIPQRQTSMATYGWLARNTMGLLTISPNKPERMGDHYWIAEGSRPFPRDQFRQITYDRGPVRVRIQITIDEDETM